VVSPVFGSVVVVVVCPVVGSVVVVVVCSVVGSVIVVEGANTDALMGIKLNALPVLGLSRPPSSSNSNLAPKRRVDDVRV